MGISEGGERGGVLGYAYKGGLLGNGRILLNIIKMHIEYSH